MENQYVIKFIFLLFFLILSIYPVCRIYECLKSLYFEYKSLKYEEVIGEIISSEIKFMIYTRTYRLMLENSFQYEINGSIYISNQNYASDFIMNSEYQTINNFPYSYSKFSIYNIDENNLHYQDLQKEMLGLMGSIVTIYYDLKNPENSCLKKGFKFNTSFSLVKAILGLVIIYYFLLKDNLI